MNKKNRAVITGIGVLSSIGIEKNNFWNSINNEAYGVKNTELFDVSGYSSKKSFEICNFEAKDYIKSKLYRYLDRSTKFILSATKFAMDDRSYSYNENELSESGVILGTALGGINSICSFDRESVENPNYVNPMLFPNTVINSPASQVSVHYGMANINMTISTGMAAGVDAIGVSLNYIRDGRCKCIFAGGVDELCLESYLGFYNNNVLSKESPDRDEHISPYDSNRNGTIIGEGAGMLIIENLESAVKKKVEILGEVVGYGTCCDSSHAYRYNPDAIGAKYSIIDALDDAGMEPSDIDCICGSGNGSINGDIMEMKSIKEIFANYLDNLNVYSIKSSIGECNGASGIFQTISAIMSMENNIVPATKNFNSVNNEYKSILLSNKNIKKNINNILINGFDCNGTNASIIVSKYQ